MVIEMQPGLRSRCLVGARSAGRAVAHLAAQGVTQVITSAAALLLCALAGGAAQAADAAPPARPMLDAYPQRQVRILVPFPPGGNTDVMARLLAERLGARWQQQVVVENRPGANGIVAAEALGRARPDGYTLMCSPLGPITINPSLYRSLPYVAEQLVPLARIGSFPSVLVVRARLPAARPQDLIALARAAPELYTFASQGVGSSSHLTSAMFATSIGLRLRHVPYNGSGAALNALAGDVVDLFFDNVSSPLPLHRSGRVRILGVASLTRLPLLPEVPTLDESGVRRFESHSANLLVGPPGMAPALAAAINGAVGAVFGTAQIRDHLAETGGVFPGGTVAQTTRYVEEQRRHWQQVIAAAGIHIE